RKRAVMWALYGIPTTWLAALWALMAWSSWGQDSAEVLVALFLLRNLALGYIALSVVIFILCFACLVHSYRTAQTRADRTQVRWLLWAPPLAFVPTSSLLIGASGDPARLGLSRSAWPMIIVSLLYTTAYALSITRYKLMQAEELLNRGVVYFLVSLVAGLLYSGLLVVSALAINGTLVADFTGMGALVAGLTAIGVLVVFEALRP